ncbi:peptidoglycan-binding domain-containing protein [Azospirillum canadense]|uniref:peptidoglycan-binding domain-containing protein n=1 Tax=Azospirillum canadense TaxID=403962 RepID=UPI0022273AF7|nr:peptidoglycan-binding domain-containing protein [Azospirillum canadense]MCW2241630.1 peptidoglycan hydrolase-like protein with peptidoglycan-binding domain [Azospirillum canadense]
MKAGPFAAAVAATMLLASSAYAQNQGQQTGHPNLDKQTVMQIQQKLDQQGFHSGKVDGEWGPETQAALKNFQQQKGMQATGEPDQQTLAALGMPSQAMSGSSGTPSNGSGSSGSDQQQNTQQNKQ